MHAFTELVGRGTGFILSALNETTTKTIEALQSSAAASLVKTLQMVQVQKTIMAVGMFSLFESMLQDSLQSTDGFAEAAKILDEDRAAVLQETFVDFQMAVNVLKHGRGRSRRGSGFRPLSGSVRILVVRPEHGLWTGHPGAWDLCS